MGSKTFTLGDNCLIGQLIKNGDPEKFNGLLHFIRNIGANLSTLKKEKIISLWDYIINEISKHEQNNKFSEFKGNLIDWIVLLDEIDSKSLRRLKFSIPNMSRFLPNNLIKEFLRLIEKSTAEVGILFLEICKQDFHPNYYKDDIISIIKILKEKGEDNIAIQISNSYFQNNQDFLISICKEENNKKKELNPQ
jgi:hypothetical protein